MEGACERDGWKVNEPKWKGQGEERVIVRDRQGAFKERKQKVKK